jgi:hypothetical protein
MKKTYKIMVNVKQIYLKASVRVTHYIKNMFSDMNVAETSPLWNHISVSRTVKYVLLSTDILSQPLKMSTVSKVAIEIGSAMAQAVSCRPLTMEAWVRARISPWGVVVDKVALGQVLYELFGFLLSISFHRGSPYSYITCGMNTGPVYGRSSET